MSGRTIGNLILMTLICVVVFIVFMAVRPTKASANYPTSRDPIPPQLSSILVRRTCHVREPPRRRATRRPVGRPRDVPRHRPPPRRETDVADAPVAPPPAAGQAPHGPAAQRQREARGRVQ